LVETTRHDLDVLGCTQILLRNEMTLAFTLEQLVFAMAVAPQRATSLRAVNIEAGTQRMAS
jgi:hypothetical protein